MLPDSKKRLKECLAPLTVFFTESGGSRRPDQLSPGPQHPRAQDQAHFELQFILARDENLRKKHFKKTKITRSTHLIVLLTP